MGGWLVKRKGIGGFWCPGDGGDLVGWLKERIWKVFGVLVTVVTWQGGGCMGG